MDQKTRKTTEEKLLDQIREQRARLDPDILKRAGAAIENNPASAKEPTEEPYDKKAAKSVIAEFLENHDDPEGFQEKLQAAMRKDTH